MGQTLEAARIHPPSALTRFSFCRIPKPSQSSGNFLRNCRLTNSLFTVCPPYVQNPTLNVSSCSFNTYCDRNQPVGSFCATSHSLEV